MLAEECIHYWISAAPADEAHIEEVKASIDALVGLALTEEESLKLLALLERREVGLVRRYIELKLSDAPSLSEFLGKQDEELLAAFAEASLVTVLRKWLSSFSISLTSTNATSLIRELRQLAGSALSVKGKYLLTEIVGELEKQIDPLEFLHKYASNIELLLFWEEEINALLASIHSISVTPIEELRLELFERTLSAFHQECGRMVSSQLLSSLGPYARSTWIGTFRLLFEEVNRAYNSLKSKLTSNPCDLHLTCLCHFAPAANGEWTFNNRVIHPPRNIDLPNKQSEASLLVFTCGGGRGHLSATQAIAEYVRGSFHIYVANTLEETFASSDPIRKMAFNFSQEKLYNHLLKNEEFEWIKLLTSVGPFFLMLQQERLERLIRLEILRHNPDLLVSCFPVFNGIILKVAKEFDLPLLIIPTDLDATLFAKGIQEVDYPRYRFTLAYEDAEMRKLIERHLPSDRIAITGFPVRSAFNTRPSLEELQAVRSRYQISEDERVLLIVMGGNASQSTEKYAQILAQFEESDLEIPLRVICLCGDQMQRENRKMLRRINQLVPTSSKIKIQGLPAVDDVSDLMNIADVLITKPGGCTTNEAIAKGLPMIFHAPFALMDWEVFNMEFCIRHQMGARFRMHANTVGLFHDGLTKNKERLLPLIKEALEDPAPHKVDFERKIFGREFLNLANQLYSER